MIRGDDCRSVFSPSSARTLLITVTLAAAGLLFIGVLLGVSLTLARAHDAHDATSPEEARVYEFYSSWRRPKGNFEGIEHRGPSCCNKQDCGRVLETRRNKTTQRLEVRVCTEFEVCEPDRWYPVDPAVIEANQEDPRESPDGGAHACVIGGVVACYTGGGGT